MVTYSYKGLELEKAKFYELTIRVDENSSLREMLSALSSNINQLYKIQGHFRKIVEKSKLLLDLLKKDEVSTDTDIYYETESIYEQSSRRLKLIDGYFEVLMEEF